MVFDRPRSPRPAANIVAVLAILSIIRELITISLQIKAVWRK